MSVLDLLLGNPLDCEPLDQAEFRSLVVDAQEAGDQDDAPLQAAIVEGVLDRLPCLTFVPTPRIWAEFLVNDAIVEFARGGDWQTPLTAALRIRPEVDRGVGLAHPISQFVPPEAPEAGDGGPVPERVNLFVDGSPVQVLPVEGGLHLVQKEDDGDYATVLLRDEPIDEDWLAAPVAHPPEPSGWVLGSLRAGTGINGQLPSWNGDYIRTEATWFGSMLAIDLRGGAGYGPLKGQVAFSSSLKSRSRDNPDEPLTGAFVRTGMRYDGAATWDFGEIDLGAGAGNAGLTVIEGYHIRNINVAYGFLLLSLPDLGRCDVSLLVGGGRSMWTREELRFGWTNKRTATRRTGFEIGFQYGHLVQDGYDGRHVEAPGLYLALDYGLIGGKR